MGQKARDILREGIEKELDTIENQVSSNQPKGAAAESVNKRIDKSVKQIRKYVEALFEEG